MKQTFFRFTGTLLCIVAGVLLSLLELRFFQGSGPTLRIFLVIAALTIPAVFLYRRSRTSVFFPLLYTVGLVLILEALGLRGKLWVPLACLFVLALLYMQTQLAESARRAGRTGSSAPGPAFAAALICGMLVMLSTVQIYKTVLVPQLPEKPAVTVYPGRTGQPEPERTAPPQPLSREKPAAGDAGREARTSLAPPADWGTPLKWLLLLAAAAAAGVLLGMAAFQYIRYRSWRNRVLAAPKQRQISAFYRYFLRCLAACGCPRAPGETPLEYLRQAETEDFPLPMEAFGTATQAFLASFYGGKEVSSEAYEDSLVLFQSAPGRVKANKGRKFYYLHYLRKMYWNRGKTGGPALGGGGDAS